MVVVRRELCVQPESKPAFIPRPRLIRHTQLKHRHPGLVAGIHESSRNLLTLLLLVTLRLACVTTMVRIIIKGGVCLSACLFFLSVLIMGSRCLEGMSVYLCSSCSFQSSPRTPKTRSSRLPSLSMARISGPVYPLCLSAKHQSSAKPVGMNGLILQSKRQNGPRQKTKSFSIWQSSCPLNGEQ